MKSPVRTLPYLLALALLGAQAHAQETQEGQDQDQPADQIEENWHNVYSKYYSKSLSEEEWSQLAGDKINETYKVQKGDTLWGISTTLFGNGFYWPKIWQLNDDITNPHNIATDYEIHFTAGTTETPPEVKLVNKAPLPPVLADKGTTARKDMPNELTTTPTIPPPAFKYRPVLEKIPPSLPTLVARKQDNNYDKSGFSLEEKKTTFWPEKIYLQSYLAESNPEEGGKVVEAEADQTQAGNYQYVYVKLDKGEIGKRYVSYSVGKSLVDPEKRTKTSGKPIYYGGEMEVVELVNASQNVFKAIVTKCISPVTVDSYVIESKLDVIDLTPTDDFAKVSGQVIGGELENSRYNLGLYSFIYIDVGSEQGVKEGQMIRILKNERIRKEEHSYVRIEEHPIGEAKVVKVTPKYTTAVVLRMNREIRVGDYAGDKVVVRPDKSDVDDKVADEVADEVAKEAKNLKVDPMTADQENAIDESVESEKADSDTNTESIEEEIKQ